MAGPARLPATFNASDYNWRVKLPGTGHSSPVVWGEHIFLSCDLEGLDGRQIVCLRVDDGKLLWTHTEPLVVHGKHELNSFSSSTPAVDADRVYFLWSTEKQLMLLALDHDGRQVWRKPVGDFQAKWGGGFSPIVVEDVVVVGNDNQARSSLMGLNPLNGETLWEHQRRAGGPASYATPAVYRDQNGSTQVLFTSTTHGFTSLEPSSGKLNWETNGVFQSRCVSSPVIVGDLVFSTAGQGGGGRQAVAVKISSGEIKYNLRRALPYVPTAVAVGGLLFLWSDGGVVSCIRAETGQEIWQQRVGGTYYGSPICADGRLFAMSQQGELVVLRASPQFELLGRYDLGEPSQATATVSNGVMYLRTNGHLISVGERIEGDWASWRGPRGDGTWHGPPLGNRWPDAGLPVRWRKPIGGGYAGVSVAQRRVLTMDRPAGEQRERVQCRDARSGEMLWENAYEAVYEGLDYDSGPRAAAMIHDGRVYTLGAVGHLRCLDAATGKAIWVKDTVAELNAKRPVWGFSASPVIWKNLLIAHLGAEPGGCLVAFDHQSGQEVWRAGLDPAGYCTPILIELESGPQLVCWTPLHVMGIAPKSGQVLWSIPYEVKYGVSIASPIFQENLLLVSGYWEGTKAIRLGPDSRDAKLAWTDRNLLRGLMSQPLYRDGQVYLLDKFYGLSCFELATGRKLWDDQKTMTPKGAHPQATMVWTGHGDKALVLNSDGQLILARFNPDGYQELSRTKIIGPTWAHPAFSGRFIYARDDKELVCVELK